MKVNEPVVKKADKQYATPESRDKTLKRLQNLDPLQSDKHRLEEWLDIFSSFRSFISSNSRRSSKQEKHLSVSADPMEQRKKERDAARYAYGLRSSKSESKILTHRKGGGTQLGFDNKAGRRDSTRSYCKNSKTNWHFEETGADEGISVNGMTIHTTSTTRVRTMYEYDENVDHGKVEVCDNQVRSNHLAKVPTNTEITHRTNRSFVLEERRARRYLDRDTNNRRLNTLTRSIRTLQQRKQARFPKKSTNTNEWAGAPHTIRQCEGASQDKCSIDAEPILQVGTQISNDLLHSIRIISQEVEKEVLERSAEQRNCSSCFCGSKSFD